MEDKGSRENKSPAHALKQQGLLEQKREITAPQKAVAKFLLPLVEPGLSLTLFTEVLHMVPTGFPGGHRSFGVKEFVSGSAAKGRRGMKFSAGILMEFTWIPWREGKRFYPVPGHMAMQQSSFCLLYHTANKTPVLHTEQMVFWLMHEPEWDPVPFPCSFPGSAVLERAKVTGEVL